MRFLLALLLIVGLSQEAAAVRAATSDEYNEIVRWITSARWNEDQITAISILRVKARNAKDWEEVAKYDAEINFHKRERRNCYGQAIWQTIVAYELLPFDAKGDPMLPQDTITYRSANQNKSKTWLPTFDDNKMQTIQNQMGLTKTVSSLPDNPAGNTASDGVSRIFPNAFSDPAFLASTILHEKRHFRLFTSPGEEGANLTHGERELKALETEEYYFDTLGFSGRHKAAQAKRLATEKGKYAAEAKEERLLVDKAQGLPLDEYDIRTPSQQWHTSIMQEADALKASIAKQARARHLPALQMYVNRYCDDGSFPQVDRENLYRYKLSPDLYRAEMETFNRAGRDSSPTCRDKVYYAALWALLIGQMPVFNYEAPRIIEPLPREDPPLAEHGPALAPMSAMADLVSLARKACASPNITRADRNVIIGWFPNSNIVDAFHVLDKVSGCPKALVEELLEVNKTMPSGNKVNVDWINERAAYLMQHVGPEGGTPPGPGQGGDTNEPDSRRKDIKNPPKIPPWAPKKQW